MYESHDRPVLVQRDLWSIKKCMDQIILASTDVVMPRPFEFESDDVG
jgi:hypothetical protein